MSEPYRVPTTLQAVRDYVTAVPPPSGRSADTLLLNVTHSNLKKTQLSEIRLDRHTTLGAAKDRLYLHTGTRPAHMTLFVRRGGGALHPLLDERQTLAALGVVSGDSLLLRDDDPHSASAGGWLEDTSLVPKFELSAEQYAAHPKSYKRYKDKMRETDPTWSMTSALKRAHEKSDGSGNKSNGNGPTAGAGAADEADLAEDAPAVAVGDRVEVFPGARRATVKFVGSGLHDMPDGWWVGVQYDEPVGKNDGMVGGVRYFSAASKYGGFVRPSRVTVGDFPPLDDDELNESDESEDEI